MAEASKDASVSTAPKERGSLKVTIGSNGLQMEMALPQVVLRKLEEMNDKPQAIALSITEDNKLVVTITSVPEGMLRKDGYGNIAPQEADPQSGPAKGKRSPYGSMPGYG